MPAQAGLSHAWLLPALVRIAYLVSISRFLHLSWSTIDRWITRFEAEHLAGPTDKKRGPKTPLRKVWFLQMV